MDRIRYLIANFLLTLVEWLMPTTDTSKGNGILQPQYDETLEKMEETNRLAGQVFSSNHHYTDKENN